MVNIDYSKTRAVVKQPGHKLHNKQVFVEWSKVAKDGTALLVITDADEPFEFIEIKAEHVIYVLSKEEKRDKLVVSVFSIVIYVLLAGAFVLWMTGAFK